MHQPPAFNCTADGDGLFTGHRKRVASRYACALSESSSIARTFDLATPHAVELLPTLRPQVAVDQYACGARR
eukprot:3297-Eustigmatos_ZCMA.PRE.1